MNKKFEKELLIYPSMADMSGKLGFEKCFDLFMDIAGEHADELGFGVADLAKKGQFWLTVKTIINFKKRPRIYDKVVVSTWAESSEGTRCIRDYQLTKDGEILVNGRTQWAVMDTIQKKLIDMSEIYSKDLEIADDDFELDYFTKFEDNFSEEPFAEYLVKSIDIDFNGHMNNVAYIRTFQSVFSSAEWKAMKPEQIEIQFIKSCFEGETIEFRKQVAGSEMFVKGSVGDRLVVFIKVKMA